MKAKIITKRQAEILGLTNGGGSANFAFSAMGKIGNKKAEIVEIHNIKTGEKQILFDKGKTFKFKGFKIK